MKRIVRQALDLSLISINKIRPPTLRLWNAAKSTVKNSPAKPLVENPVLPKLEATVGSLVQIVEGKMKELRGKMLPDEIAHLEQELAKAKKALEDAKRK